jgi:hypothetical protein
MGKIVRDLKDEKKKVPVAYFSTRSAYEGKPENETLTGGPALAVAVSTFCEAVGYPKRPSLLSPWTVKDASVNMPTGPAKVSVEPAAVNHFAAAIKELFEVCSELRSETGKIPFIVVDEFHDFMSDRLRWAGGETLFVLFANAMLHYGLDKKRVKVVVGASGSQLLSDLEKLTKARDFRVDTFFTEEDPSPEAILKRLKALGYSDETAQRIVATCGTRLRILEPFLTREEKMPFGPNDVRDQLEKVNMRAEQSVNSLLVRAKDAGVRHELVTLLGKVEKGEVVRMESVPLPLRTPFPNDVLYMAEGGRVMFQSIPMKKAWMECS